MPQVTPPSHVSDWAVQRSKRRCGVTSVFCAALALSLSLSLAVCVVMNDCLWLGGAEGAVCAVNLIGCREYLNPLHLLTLKFV